MPKIRKRLFDSVLTSLAINTQYAHVLVFIYMMGVYINVKIFVRNRLLGNSVIDAEKHNYSPLRC